MKITRVAPVITRRILLGFKLLVCFWIVLGPTSDIVFAAPVSSDELLQLKEDTNWVVCGGGSDSSSASGASGGGGTTSGTASGGSYSFTSPQQGWIDTDVNWGPMAGGGDASKTSFVALSSEEATKTNPNMQGGDIIVLAYKGKVAYAIYGDSAASRSSSSPYPHGFGDGTQYLEVSPHVATTLIGTADNLPPGVQVTLYPGTAHLLGSSNADQRDQAKIDQVGAQVSGGGAPSSGSSGGTGGTSCCPPSGADNSSTTATTPSGGGSGKYGALVGTGANFAGIDQGIDFTPTGSFKILAPASGTITMADQTGHSFQRTSGTAEIQMKMDQAPASSVKNSSQYIYFAEIIKLDGAIKVGAHVSKGDVIGVNDASPGIEVGWATDGKGGWLCGIGIPTPCGASFNAWIIAGGGGNSAGSSSGGASGGQCCPSGSGSSSGPLTGKDNEEKIWNYFKGKGLSDVQVAALLGNFQQESSFNPTEVESDGNTNDPSGVSVGWGLVQWTPGSKVLAEQKSNKISGPIYELATQLDLVWAEMTVTHFGGFDDKAFKAMTDLGTATDYFTSNFEHAGIVGPRTQYAQDALKKYGGKGGSGSSTSSGGSSGSGASCSASSSSSGYKNPLRDVKSLVPKRIDQGVDYGGHGPIYAIGNGKVDLVFAENGGGSGWPGPGGAGGAGGWISYTLSDGPAKGKIVYFAENCNPTVKKDDMVTSSTVICQMDGDNSSWSEEGWASGSNTQPFAQTIGGNGCCSTTAGVNFSDLLKSLGAPAGVLTNPPIGSPMPSDFPKWK